MVIVSTIAIQVYWNYKNYQTNKQQLINDVQTSLDNALDSYYENLAKKSTLGFAVYDDAPNGLLNYQYGCETMMSNIDIQINNSGFDENKFSTKDTLYNNITVLKGNHMDSLLMSMHDHKNEAIRWERTLTDSSRKSSVASLTSKVVFAITNDSLKLREVDSLLRMELKRKSLNLDVGLTFKDPFQDIKTFNKKTSTSSTLSTSSKSMLLPEFSEVKVYFDNATKIILKRILSGILISTLLVMAVISCLLYMLKIINQQKQLAEVKNDLISNITHEFKTPIATISVALESIKDFNVIDDKVKTKTYLELSTNQLSKLNIMVEKLLETATLDSENLNLNKETVDIVQMLGIQVEKHQMQTANKTLLFNASAENIMAKVDVFHFENAINNVIDNAVKYGGDSISVQIQQEATHVDILISDDGNTLTQANLNQIFEKFYRVSKGNTHDVKGFGIGLYYTKKIIEKHGGTIVVNLKDDTTFKITIPNT